MTIKEPDDQTESPLKAVAGDAGSRATEAFSILGHKTRLAILLALWDEYDPFATENTVPFTELRDRVDIPQGGQFTYHLKQLVGHFIRKTDTGYELRRAGLHLVQTVIAGTGIQDPVLEPTEIEQDCYLCGGATMVPYQDEMRFWACTECDGKKGGDGPEGLLAAGEFDPAGFINRTPKEMLNAAWTGGLLNFGLGGVCDACWGPMESWLHLCDDHADEGICPNCGFQEAVVARFLCSVCKRHHQMVPWWLVIDHPAVVAFYYDRGIPLQYEDGVNFQPRIDLNLQAYHNQELIAENPLLVRVVIQYEGDELRLMLDEELNVIEVSKRT